MSGEATIIKLTYQHAFVSDELRQTAEPSHNKLKAKQNEDSLTEIKTCVINTECKLTVIGLSNGKIIYWRPSKIDNLMDTKMHLFFHCVMGCVVLWILNAINMV